MKYSKVLTEKSIRDVISSCPSLTLCAFISVMYATGARISEICNLSAADLIRSDSSIRIRGLKDGYERFVPVPRSLFLILDAYWKDACRPQDKHAKVFPLGVQYWRKQIKSLFLRHGVAMTPHCLRHSRATHLMNAGAPVSMLQGFLGHKSILSTSIYTHYAIEPMRKFIGGVL